MNHLYNALKDYARKKKRAAVCAFLAFVVIFTTTWSLPVGLWPSFTEKAYASTNMRIEPSEINTDKQEKAKIIFSFNADDNGQAKHEVKINLCTPNPNGGPPALKELIASGTYDTKDSNGHYLVHEVEWDGKINGVPLKEGKYTIAVSPMDYNGIGVYYGQMASFEIRNSVQPAPPQSLNAKAAASGDGTMISGTAEAGSTVSLEVFYSGSDAEKTYSPIQVNSQGQWQQKVSLDLNRIARIGARAERDGLQSSYSQQLSILRTPIPSFPVTWEQLAAYYYKANSTVTVKTMTKQLADLNGSTNGSGTVTGLNALLIQDPEVSEPLAQSDLAQFTEQAVADRLRIVNPSGQGPVEPARGDFNYQTDRLTLQALMQLQFGLSYLSREANIGATGLGWHHSYEWRLTPVDGKLELMRPDGSRFEYVPLSGGRYLTPRGTDWTLQDDTGSGHLLKTPQGTAYRFDSEGLLASITDLTGNQVMLSYSGKQLMKVATRGAELALTYDHAGKLAGVSDHSGRSLSLSYDSNGDMVSFADVDGASTKFGYDNRHRVISVSDPKQSATMTVHYDEHGRVTSYTDFYGKTSTTAYEGKVSPVIRGEDEEQEPDDEVGIHPGQGRDIPAGDEVLLSGNMNNLAHAPAYRKVPGLLPVIKSYLDSSVEAILRQQGQYEASAVAADSNEIASIQKTIASIGGSGVAIVRTGYLNVESSVTFGSPEHPVVLIAEGMNTNQDITVTVYGTLILKQGLNANTKLKVHAYRVGGDYGNLWSGGAIHLNNDSQVQVESTLYGGSLTYNSGQLTVNADRILVKGDLSINTKVKMSIAQEMLLGGIVSNNEVAELNVSGGDLFVRDNVSVNNNLSIQTGGVFAIGGDMTPNQTPKVQTGVGSGKTILTYPKSGSAAPVAAYRLSATLAAQAKSTQTDRLGHSMAYTWNDRFLLAAVVNPDGTTVRYGYDNADRLADLTDGNGGVQRLIHDERGNEIQAIDGNGESSVIRYNKENRPVQQIDALGAIIRYSYDASGNLLATTDALGNQSTIERDATGVPVRVTDALGQTTEFVNDEYGFVKTVQDPSGYVKTIVRDALHRVMEVRDDQGLLEQTVYDAKDRAVERRNAAQLSLSSTYDANGNLTKETDEQGQETSYQYDVYRSIGTTDAAGKTSSTSYDANGNVKEETDANGNRTAYTYDALNRLQQTTDAAGQTTVYTYDANGNLLTEQDANGQLTRHTYDRNNSLLSITDPLGAVISYRYDAAGHQTKVTDPLGNSTWFTYNAAGQLTESTDALGNTTTYQYDASGRQISTIDAEGSVWQTKYDKRGLDSGTINPLGQETTLIRDDRGRVTESRNAAGGVTRYEYDSLDRTTKIINPLGSTTGYEYDALGRVIRTTDANHGVTSFRYDVLGQLTGVTDAGGHETAYAYDALGNLLSKTNARGAVTEYQYDVLNRVVEKGNPLKEATQYSYDAAGNLQSQLAPDKTKTTYGYDDANHVISIQYSDGQEVAYGYDLAGRRIAMKDSNGDTRYTYDALGRLTEAIDYRGRNVRYEWNSLNQRSRVIYPDNTTVSYEYDKAGRMTRVTDGQGQETAYTYDAGGRIKGKALQNGGTSAYQYNDAGQVTGIRHLGPGGALLEQLSYTYDPAGNLVHWERQKGGSDEDNPSGATQQADIADYVYDALNQLTQVQKRNGTQTSYTYDAAGNRLSKTVAGGGSAGTETYAYDPANKLTHWEKGSDYRDYAYDLRGNLLTVTGTDSTSLLRAQSPSADMTVPGSVYAQDGGSVTNEVYGDGTAPDGIHSLQAALAGPRILEAYSWDAANRLTAHTNEWGDQTVYRYDGNGSRVYMGVTLGSTARQDGYPASNPAGLRDGWETQYKKQQSDTYFTNDVTLSLPEPLEATGEEGSAWKQNYTYGANEERISMSYVSSADPNSGWEPTAGAGATSNASPKTLYYLTDMLGSVLALEGQDGSISARYDYDEFGTPENPEKFDLNYPGPDNLFGYTGLGYDFTSGLSHAEARYFDPTLGRFVSEDTYEGEIENPQSLNLYAYVENNPLIYTDPTGHWQEGDEKLSSDVQFQISILTSEWDSATSTHERNRIHAEAELLRTLDKLFSDEFGRKAKFGQNTTVAAVNKILKYTNRIDIVSYALGVDNSMIAAVMFREIRCFGPSDNFDTLKLKIRGDASIGLGQIFVKTAQRSEKLARKDAPEYSDKQMAKRLLDEQTSIYYIGIVLKANSIILKEDSSVASVPILALYNGKGNAAKKYGEQTYQYSLAFRKYYNTIGVY
ncbi:RHS repeat-associated core domain-containing protein [Gorillibacterium timonense]|uniref:RHS repeat-associated core domain-containing protein n=1 Tax=Gorillibacterium timonense TaxID=1689269 RepID=UPI00131E48C5|nr:RHS repeat-associated core domain-containing protein [Gorillibacterium timonense]